MVIKKKARLAQSLELLAHGNKPALEKTVGSLFSQLYCNLPSYFQSLTDVWDFFFLFKRRKHNFTWMSDFSC